MTVRWLVATFHLLALAIGLGAIVVRGRLLRRLQVPDELPAVFRADNLWGLAALLWLGTGLARAFGGLEKGTEYYITHPLFLTKMVLFVIVVLLEVRPAMTLVRWRRRYRSGAELELGPARWMAMISSVQGGIVVVIVFLATAIARGIGNGSI